MPRWDHWITLSVVAEVEVVEVQVSLQPLNRFSQVAVVAVFPFVKKNL